MTLHKNRYACALYLKFNLNSRVVYSFMFLNSSFYINITPKTNILMIINKFMKEKKKKKKKKKSHYIILEDTARYAGLLLAPAEGFGLRPRLFLHFGQKKSLLCCFGPFLAFFGVQ